MIFRIGNKNDLESIAKIHAESWQQTYKGIYSDDFLESNVVENRKLVWEERFQNPENQIVIIAEEKFEIIGFICIYPDFDEKFGSLIDNLHIKNSFQGRGIGRELMQKADDWISENTQSKRKYLWVYEKNVKAKSFYEKLGAKPFEIQALPSPDAQMHDAARMVWGDFLSPPKVSNPSR